MIEISGEDSLVTGKKEIRSLMKRREQEFLRGGTSGTLSEEIMLEVESLPAFVSADTVLCYMSVPGEVETDGMLARWFGRKRIVVPLVVGDTLELREYGPLKIVSGYRGIREPSMEATVVDPSEIGFAIIPGVAFSKDASGAVRRLGHGKGFYDRLLPSLNCPKAGVGFSFRVVDFVPSDPWDIPLDILIAR